ITTNELKNMLGIDGIKVVGVTGTNGKTKTKAIIYSLLLDLGYKCALSGTRGFFIDGERIKGKSLNTVDVLENFSRIKEAKDRGCEFYITEVSSHAIAQERLEGIDFSLKVLTNITSDHLDYHKSIEEYRRVKNSFFEDESMKLVNKDDRYIRYNQINAYTYGVEDYGSFTIKAYELTPFVGGVICFGTQSAVFESSLIGKFNLYNLEAAIASVTLLVNKPLEDVCEAISGFGGVEGRAEVVNEKPLVIVDFAHTADGIKEILESFAGRDIVALFGAGGDRDRSKREKMGASASRYAKKLYITSDNPRSEDPKAIAQDIARGVSIEKEIILDRKSAINKALDELKEDEILLILGKGDEEYMEIKGKKIPFKDREVVKDYFQSRNMR
ncbi:MAG: UDP-N-acetylmuramoyl-L-alanyl-D-glutamate--2,6-diaminopimelate ligase, partial [Campylobacterales bacterium]